MRPAPSPLIFSLVALALAVASATGVGGCGLFGDASRRDASASAAPPPAPLSLRAAVIGYDRVALRWQMPEGASGVRGYRVRRDGAIAGECAVPEFVDRGVPLTSRHAHRYAVTAIGASGLESLPSTEETTSTAFPREAVPEPILGDSAGLVELYYRAWEGVWSRLREPEAASGFTAPYVDEPSDPEILAGNAAVLAAFARHGHGILPAAESLDNFYVKQRPDGFIGGRLRKSDGSAGGAPEAAEDAIAPPLFAWVEWLCWLSSGDAQRLQKVAPRLEDEYRWIQKNRRRDDGLYRAADAEDTALVELSAQQALTADCLRRIAVILQDEAKARAWDAEYRSLRDLVNERMWDSEDQIYYDLAPDGSFRRVKTLASFWPLAAGIPDRARAAALVYHLQDPKSFNRPHLFPGLAASEPLYRPDGDPRLGGVRDDMNAMVLHGLSGYGYSDVARIAAANHLANVERVFRETSRLWDSYAPEAPAAAAGARGDAAGASGYGPVAALIENVIGIEPNAAIDTLFFRVRQTERNGVRNYRFAGHAATIVCEARRSADEPCEVTVETDGPVSIVLETPWADFPIGPVGPGVNHYRLMRPTMSSP